MRAKPASLRVLLAEDHPYVAKPVTAAFLLAGVAEALEIANLMTRVVAA